MLSVSQPANPRGKAMSLESITKQIREEISKYATPARSAELTDRWSASSHGYAPTFAFARR